MQEIFLKGIARYCCYKAMMSHVSQPYAGAEFWGRDRLIPAKISQSLCSGEGGWLLLVFAGSLQQLLQRYARIPMRRGESFLGEKKKTNKNHSQKICFAF